MNMKKLFSIVLVSIFMLSLISFIPVGNSQVVGSGSIDSGLVGYWRFDEGSGVSALDSSGNGKTVSYSNFNWTTGKYSSGITCNSTTANSLSLSQFVNSTTVSSWIYMTSNPSTNGYIVSEQNDVVQFRVRTDGKLDLLVHTTVDVFVSTTVPLSLNQWLLITGVYDSVSGFSIYVNGDLVSITGNTTYTGVINHTLGTLTFGTYLTLPRYLIGKIDDFRIYNRALSASEILTLYQGVPVVVSHDAGSTVTPNGTVLVGVDQSQSFIVGASNGYIPWTQYINGVANAPLSVVSFNGVQTNQTFYVTSQFTGIFQPTPTPSPSPTPEGYTPTPTPIVTPGTTAGLDLTIFIIMIVIEAATLILALKLKGLGLLGIFGGLLGSIFSYIAFTNQFLILNTNYDQAAHVFVNQAFPMGFFAWIPLILAVSNFIAAVYAK